MATTREDVVTFLLKENLDREDVDVTERAHGVPALVDVCSEGNPAGARTRAAERLATSEAWVTDQVALLSLPDGIQGLLSPPELPERDGRLLAQHLTSHPELEPAQLLAHRASVREREAQVKEEERSARRRIRPPPSAGTGGSRRTRSPDLGPVFAVAPARRRLAHQWEDQP